MVYLEKSLRPLRFMRLKGTTMTPKDPVMLLSFVNMKLRDRYKDLDTLCEDLDLEPAALEAALAPLDYHYDPDRNQFV